MTDPFTAEALTAPQSASQGPEPLGTRNRTRSALHGAHRALLCRLAPSLIGSARDAPRMALGATHSRELTPRTRKHAAPSAGALEAFLADSLPWQPPNELEPEGENRS